MALPKTEAFTGTNGANVTTITGWVANLNTIQIYTNSFCGKNTDFSLYHWGTDTPDNDQYSKGKIVAIHTALGHAAGTAIRVNASIADGYIFYADGGSPGTSWFATIIDRSEADIGSDRGAFSVNDVMELRAVGTAVSLWKNSVQIGTDITNTTFSSGFGGICAYANNTVTRMDNVEIGNVTAGGQPNAPRALYQQRAMRA